MEGIESKVSGAFRKTRTVACAFSNALLAAFIVYWSGIREAVILGVFVPVTLSLTIFLAHINLIASFRG